MKNNLEEILKEIKYLEDQVTKEIQEKEKELRYKIVKRRIIFEKEAARLHKKLKMSVPRYLVTADFLSYLIAPVIYSMIIPALILDAFVSFYQLVCFPVYGAPYVKRSDYIVMDRQYLKYINILERINCVFCEYFNGLIAYVEEISAVTEQYWCPIKHARKLKSHHSRYYTFLDFGDGNDYEKRLQQLREKIKAEKV